MPNPAAFIRDITKKDMVILRIYLFEIYGMLRLSCGQHQVRIQPDIKLTEFDKFTLCTSKSE